MAISGGNVTIKESRAKENGGRSPQKWHTEPAVLGGGFFEVKTERSGGGGGGADTGVDVTEQVTTCYNQRFGTQSC